MKIIIVDDDCLVVSSLKTILAANGFDIIATGSNGREAITLTVVNRGDRPIQPE